MSLQEIHSESPYKARVAAILGYAIAGQRNRIVSLEEFMRKNPGIADAFFTDLIVGFNGQPEKVWQAAERLIPTRLLEVDQYGDRGRPTTYKLIIENLHPKG